MQNLKILAALWLAANISLGLGAEQESVRPSPYIPDAPIQALQFTFDEHLNLFANHGRLCQKLLFQANPKIDPMDIRNFDIAINFAGIITSRWSQMVTRPDLKERAVWNFECVSKMLSDNKLVVISLATFQEGRGEERGIELLSRRNIRAGKYVSAPQDENSLLGLLMEPKSHSTPQIDTFRDTHPNSINRTPPK